MLVEADDFAGRRRPGLKSALSLRFRRWLLGRGPPPPWEDGAPIRAELFSVERLEDHARSLAAAQAVMPDHVKGPSLTTRLADNEAVLLAAYLDVAKAVDAGAAITPTAEWLIDNFHVVEKQIREVRVDLLPGYYRQPPKLASGPFAGYPRVHVEIDIWKKDDLEIEFLKVYRSGWIIVDQLPDLSGYNPDQGINIFEEFEFDEHQLHD